MAPERNDAARRAEQRWFRSADMIDLDPWKRDRIARFQRDLDRRITRIALKWFAIGILVALSMWFAVSVVEQDDRALCAKDPTCHVYEQRKP